MALTLSEIQAATEDFWAQTEPEDIYFESSVLLWYLMGRGNPSGIPSTMVTPGEMADGGEKIRVPLMYSNSNYSSYGNTTKIDQSKKDIVNAARFRWGGANASNAIDLNDRVQNSGDSAMVNLARSKLKNIQMTLRDALGIYVNTAAADSTYLLGLPDLFNTTTSTAYGGIAEDDMSVWAANVITAAKTMGFAFLQELRREASLFQNAIGKPNLYITTEVLRDGYERTLQVQARYRDQKLLDAGYENVLFGAAPVVADDKQTTSYCDGLNLRHLKMKTHPDFAFTTPKWEYDKAQPDYWVANCRYIGQLVTNNRKSHARATNVSAPA